MTIDAGILWAPLAAGLLVTATHAPLGVQVLNRGIVFIDLAVAQIAGLGVIFADWLGYEPQGVAVQVAALVAALAGAVLLNWTERLWPDVQEAVIGVTFIVAANAAILLLAVNPRGAEHLKDLLIGQILWVSTAQLPLIALLSAAILAALFGFHARKRRMWFYVVFACAVTLSVQLVGLYLVFTTLIVPALATRKFARGRLAACYGVAAAGYAAGLFASAITDLPAGPLIVCVMALVGVALMASTSGAAVRGSEQV
jgi:zinc/manganese transport system permease protein